ncbi:hypothetical protein [Streptomyces sp. NPDC056987]|uniref:beta family protein n=1 Tax=Streptomyces sp. NPDC056987 TaxID=3345988 RepID=UPI00363DEA3B
MMAGNGFFPGARHAVTLVIRGGNGSAEGAAMSGPLYVPVLPTRPYAADAYRRLRPEVQGATAPLWSLPPHHGLSPSALAAAVRREVAVVGKAQRHHAAWLDAPFADDTHVLPLAAVLRRAGTFGPLRPVTGPERSARQQQSAMATAADSGDGIGIRVRMPGEWDGDTADAVHDLLERTDPRVPVDLLLDLGGVLADRPDAGKETLRALDAMHSLAAWRTIAMIGGGVLQATAGALEEGWYEQPRREWKTWCHVTEGDRAYLPRLRYGDYGAQPAASLARDTRSGKGGPPWGVLRYTTEQSYVVAKMLTRGDARVAHNRTAARRLLDMPQFRGPVAGAAEAWLRDCAYGSGTGGTGNFSTWLWVGNAQHMTYVVHSLRD